MVCAAASSIKQLANISRPLLLACTERFWQSDTAYFEMNATDINELVPATGFHCHWLVE